MPEIFQPRRLPRNREYPGYQFYCVLEKQGENAESCFRFAVLCVTDWLKGRLRGTDVIPKELSRLPGRRESDRISPGDLESFTISSGFSAYAVSLPEHGIWALRLKEPDSDTDTRKAIPGRFFATNIGLRILNDRQAELGIRIDVTDPEDTPEIDFAFRPGLVRYLYEAEGMSLSQAAPLPYQKALPVESEEQLKGLRTILDSSETTLPVILVTQAVRMPKAEPAPLPGRPPFSAGPVFPAGLSAFSSGGLSASFPSMPKPEPYYPIDADEIAKHNFGYAVTCRVSERMHAALSRRLKKEYTPGDILFAEPKRFGGNIRVLDPEEKDAVKAVWQRAHCYSKDRKYPFGDVQFEFDARNIENRELIHRIRASGEMETGEKLARLNAKIDELQEENERRVQKISELKQQLLSEFRRGEEAEKHRADQLFQEYDRLEDELRKVKARNQHLEQENQSARAVRSALDFLREMPELPRTNEEVIRFFRQAFGDRIAFTERAVKSGSKCDIRPEGLWYYLYCMATDLYIIHHGGKPDVEKEFLHATGIEAAMNEGSQTNRGEKYRKQREDVYEGKEIYAAPHVKLISQRAGAENRRIYYCYDREMDRIIVSWIGTHLETAGTMHLS